MAAALQFNLLGLDYQELTAIVEKLGAPSYRARQLVQAIYVERRQALDQVSTLPRAFRQALADTGYEVRFPAIDGKFTSTDGTIRYLMSFADGQSVETVWMPEGDGGDEGEEEPSRRPWVVGRRPGSSDDGRQTTQERHDFSRATICVSSQIGCAVNCQFCLTALLGVQRNLTPGEIVGQVLAVLNDRAVDLGSERINLVFMGQGEPFLNYDNFMKAVRLLVGAVGIPESRMTVSTAGIVPRINDFGKEQVRPRLAISLNASNDPQRSEIMPINRKWNLDALLEAARAFPARPRERLTFEYVLLDGVNDAPQNAREVVRLLNGIRAKVNLIALNPGPDIPFSTPADERVHEFQQILVRAAIPTFIRRPRGRDIFAACGQLKRTVKTEPLVELR
jgi:23S rRNA (adenine2503-C2)-methyltransferase